MIAEQQSSISLPSSEVSHLFSPKVDIFSAALVVFASAASSQPQTELATVWANGETQLTMFGGRHISNSWRPVFTSPGELDYRDAYLIGGSYAKQWTVFDPRIGVGVEMQLVKQFGEQDHWEANLPVFVRYQPLKTTAFRSASFGLGLSFASEVPQVEVNNKGNSTQTLAYFFIEFEWGPNTSNWSVFTRIHHRSAAFGTFPTKGGSNALAVGVRWRR